MMHRAGWEGRKASSGMAFAWFIFDRNHDGLTTISRIDWSYAPLTAPPAKGGIAV
jgi:hypothetical protein